MILASSYGGVKVIFGKICGNRFDAQYVTLLDIDNLEPDGVDLLLEGYKSDYTSAHPAVQLLGGHAGHLCMYVD